MVASERQSLKALSPIDVIFCGMSILISELQNWKAP